VLRDSLARINSYCVFGYALRLGQSRRPKRKFRIMRECLRISYQGSNFWRIYRKLRTSRGVYSLYFSLVGPWYSLWSGLIYTDVDIYLLSFKHSKKKKVQLRFCSLFCGAIAFRTSLLLNVNFVRLNHSLRRRSIGFFARIDSDSASLHDGSPSSTLTLRAASEKSSALSSSVLLRVD